MAYEQQKVLNTLLITTKYNRKKGRSISICCNAVLFQLKSKYGMLHLIFLLSLLLNITEPLKIWDFSYTFYIIPFNLIYDMVHLISRLFKIS